MLIRPIIYKASFKNLLYIYVIQDDCKLLSGFPWPINGNPDNNLESPRISSEIRSGFRPIWKPRSPVYVCPTPGEHHPYIYLSPLIPNFISVTFLQLHKKYFLSILTFQTLTPVIMNCIITSLTSRHCLHLQCRIINKQRASIRHEPGLSTPSKLHSLRTHGLDGRRVGVQVPVGSTTFSSPRRPGRLWGPPTLLSNW
jgi:hypothetical protein